MTPAEEPTTCAARPQILGGETPCGAPAVVTYVAGCAHEHVKISPACGEHLTDSTDSNECWECWSGPQPHECPVALRELTGTTS